MPDEKYRKVLDLTDTGCVVIDSHQRLLEANVTYLELTGRSAIDQITGKSVLEWTAPADHERMRQAIRVGLYTGTVRQLEVDFVSPDGKTTPVELDAATFTIEGNVALIALCRDISKRRQAQEALQQQQTELARLARLNTMGQLATGLAHELNQPLAAILNYAGVCLDLIERAPRSDKLAPIAQALEEILGETERAGDIINRLRAHVRKHEPFRRPIELNPELADAVNLLNFELRASRVQVELELPHKIVVSADPVEIQQVATNLLRNAIDALACIPGERRIRIDTAVEDGRAVIRIADNGPGIPSDQIDKVFEPFYTTKSDGLGMGLAICRSLLQGHAGDLAVASEPGRTVFTITLPLLYGNTQCSPQPAGRKKTRQLSMS